ncbi:hypothetical protein BDW22DRAFT_1364281 [Trametopsis cervina]|nr:hypothetical protein BDW22DRAFT_1364281 [Trametopsis cervina]
MDKEMLGHFVGSIDVNTFLDRFLPISFKYTRAKVPKADFKRVSSKGGEHAMYNLLVAAIETSGCCPSFKLHNTSNNPDSITGVMPDCAMFLTADGYADGFKSNYMNDVHIVWEVKPGKEHDAFLSEGDDPNDLTPRPFENLSMKGSKNRGQQIDYATWIMRLQHRTHVFSVSIVGHNARFIRWDRSGAVVSAAFNYITGNNYLSEFLWRYEKATDEQRGFDTSAVRATLDEVEALRAAVEAKLEAFNDDEQRSKLKMTLDGHTQAYKLKVFRDGCDEIREYIVCKPFMDADSPCGRATRAYYAWGLKEQELLFLKDAWRPDVSGVLSEADVYDLLERINIRARPHVYIAGDVLNKAGEAQATVTQDSTEGTDALRPITWLRRHQHYRVVQKLAHPLFMVENSKQLVQAIRDVLEVLLDAFKKGFLLHRDISMGNVMLDAETKRGILNDWDHAIKLTDAGSCHAYRTGTWHFMSVFLLKNPGKRHALVDDIESCFWLLLYMSVHHFKHTGLPIDLEMFDQSTQKLDEDGILQLFGGSKKNDFFFSMDINKIHFSCKPLEDVLQKFGLLLNDFYHSSYRDSQVDKARKALEDGTILEIFDNALTGPGWPEENDVLPDQFPKKTDVEKKRTALKQHQGTHEFRTTRRDNDQPSLPLPPNSNPSSTDLYDSTRPNKGRTGTSSMGPPPLPVRHSRPATPEAGPSSIHRMRTRSTGNEPFPTIGGAGRIAGDMRSIDSVRSNSSKRGQRDDEKEPETTEEETDRRTKRSRKTTRAEPVQKVYQTRSRTKSDEREKKVAGSAVQPEQRATRSKARSTSRKASTVQTEQRVTRSKTRSASRK